MFFLTTFSVPSKGDLLKKDFHLLGGGMLSAVSSLRLAFRAAVLAFASFIFFCSLR